MVCCWKFLFCREEGGVITLPVNTTYHKSSQPAIFTFQAVCECSNILRGEDCLDINDRSHEVFYLGTSFIALCRREIIIWYN